MIPHLPNPFIPDSANSSLADALTVAAEVAPQPVAAAISFQSHAKATEGKAGMAGDAMICPVRRSTAGTGLRVGEASADLPATSEFMDVTAGETAPISEAAGKRPFPSVSGNTNREQQRNTAGVTAGETATSFNLDVAAFMTAIEPRSMSNQIAFRNPASTATVSNSSFSKA